MFNGHVSFSEVRGLCLLLLLLLVSIFNIISPPNSRLVNVSKKNTIDMRCLTEISGELTNNN